jgi:hypothetical protein
MTSSRNDTVVLRLKADQVDPLQFEITGSCVTGSYGGLAGTENDAMSQLPKLGTGVCEWAKYVRCR